ncbi:NADH-quinone oxidoreductase subunit L [Candidatus Nitronereus thalassa]|uniref:NADH-quinone oxidoreductase subunit L n=1 Tax=Candidatus Nitronereus thalassa TaxID=3020898 RepID=A0ABU3KAE5_9BACT|nr:NADH-quinone oxidoreductase subunit L [Candidatus Nitronereus thalassa]MDT7043386.1 NADH-quinone oxidoreductase subunit L [Candidatus Nitronereus thalassa]
MSVFVFIPLLPLLASLALVVGGRRWGDQGHRIAIPAMGLSFALSVGAFLEILNHGPISIPLYQLLQSGPLAIQVGLYLDQLTVLLLLLVTGVSGVVHVFSSRYMIGDPRYNRFFAVISFFTFCMLMLVMSSNLLIMFVFWEMMGLCSYLLISHWAQRTPAVQAATKAYLVNAIADVGLGFGIILTFATFGTLDIPTILAQAESVKDQTVNILGWMGGDFQIHPVTVIPFFLFMGAMGKSAQMPFHVWLPFAMEAPTPVSALIHAATMVNAGPFLLVRLSPLLVLSPSAMNFIAVVGAVTALFAAMVSMTQSDIKKNLAYSTISQIGFMIMTCGIGAFVAAIFHLLAHGCLKAFLFLSTGNALRAVQSHHHGEPQSDLPTKEKTWLSLGALMLACLPPFVIFSGPYEVLWAAQGFASARTVFWVMGLLTVFFTAVYIYRGIWSLFRVGLSMRDRETGIAKPAGPRLFSPSHLLMVLASGGVMGAILMGIWSWFVQFLTPALALPPSSVPGIVTPTEGMVWIVGPLGVAVLGWIYAYSRPSVSYKHGDTESEWKRAAYVLFLNKGYFDEIYEAYLVRPTLRFSHWLWRRIDVQGVDGIVYGLATVSLRLARWLWQVVDLKGIDRLTINIGRQSVTLGQWLWELIDIRGLGKTMDQVGVSADATGQYLDEVGPRTLQHHLLVMIFWLVLAIALLYILVK